MERLSIQAEARDVGRKGLNRRLRSSGKIPAVLYGHGQQPTGLALAGKEFTHLMKGVGGTNALIDLKVASQGDPLVVMVKDYQIDMISHRITHVDLYKIDMKERVTVKVPVHPTGKCFGLTKGGLLEIVRREVELRCLPANIPGSIDVDITDLDVGHSIHARDLKLPEGVELSEDADITVISVVAPREEVVAEAAPAAEAAVAAEGAPAAGAAAAPGAAAPAADAKTAKKETK